MTQSAATPYPRKQISIICLAIIALAAVVLIPKYFQTTPATSMLSTDAECDLHATKCSAQHAQQAINLDIKAEQISSAKSMLFEVELENLEANQIMLDIKGKQMYMGVNQVHLNRVAGENNRWQGEVTLPVCATGSMTWVTSVITEKDGQLTQADFEFDAK